QSRTGQPFWPANDTTAQRWVPEFVDMLRSPYMRLRNVATGLCLDVEGGSSAEGARVIQWNCQERQSALGFDVHRRSGVHPQ
ncbi:MAG TPA: RICIN domain-containing protein, partial [Kribbella sp.]